MNTMEQNMNIYRFFIGIIIMVLFFFYSTPATAELQTIYTAIPLDAIKQEKIEFLYVSTYWFDLRALQELITIFNIDPMAAEQLFQDFLAIGKAEKVPEGWVAVELVGVHENFAIYKLVR